MLLKLFFSLFTLCIIISLLSFALIPSSSLLMLAKYIAFGTAVSIIITAVYPSARGVTKGDLVVISSAVPFFANKIGTALTGGRKNSQIRVLFENGEEAVATIESYEGFLSPTKIRILYEEKLRE